ncbi:MAG TPA: hypothetical protein VJP77_01595, partial [Planctomycetota bacterium]|nr:hypothetical protein [Planctomycetota bacterium]
TTGAPVLYAGTSGTPQDSRLDVGGFVRRVLVFEDRIFVAADRAGLVVFERQMDGTWNDPAPFTFRLPDDDPDDGKRAFTLAVWRNGGDLRVLLGTVDHLGNGGLYLLAPDEPNPQNVKLAELTGLPEVWSLASYDEDHAQGPRTVVLVGTACGGLRRHHFPVDATSIPAAVATHALGGSKLVRDIAIHRVEGVETIAFVAIHKSAAGLGPGVLALNLAGNGLAPVASVVPELTGTGGADTTYCLSLAVDSDAVAGGRRIG